VTLTLTDTVSDMVAAPLAERTPLAVNVDEARALLLGLVDADWDSVDRALAETEPEGLSDALTRALGVAANFSGGDECDGAPRVLVVVALCAPDAVVPRGDFVLAPSWCDGRAFSFGGWRALPTRLGADSGGQVSPGQRCR
jgi:hypothetical protein